VKKSAKMEMHRNSNTTVSFTDHLNISMRVDGVRNFIADFNVFHFANLYGKK
jgi:hypothetical protein